MRGAARYLREAYSLYEVVSEPRIGVYTFQLSCTLLVLPNMPHILTIQNQLHPQICAQAHCRSAKALLRTSASCFLPRQACWGSRLRGVRQSTAYAQQSPDFQSPDSSGRRTLQVAFTCDKCGGRTERLVNPHAWETGLVYLQCEGCKVWHQLKDNQGMIEEVRFNEPK
ncbi:hypothetical protein ABBQ38_000782 [Trebouxia sp. C0009 RCD-2024]